MKKLLALFLALSMILGLAACGSEPPADTSEPPAQETKEADPAATDEPSGTEASVARPTEPTLVSIAGGSSSGTMFLIANAIALALNTYSSDVFNAAAESTTGTPAIIEMLNSGEIDFGWGANNTVLEAYEGTGSYEGDARTNLASLAYGYEQPIQIVVRDDDSIQSIADLKGKSFGVSNAGSTTELNARLLFSFYDIDYINRNDLTPQYIGESQASDLISNKQLDGVLANAAVGSSGMMTLMTSGDCKMLSIDEDVIEKLCEASPAFIPYTIPANTYDNQPEDIRTVAVVNYIYCRADLSEELAYWFLDTIYAHNDDLVATHSAGETIVPENAGIGMVIPMHPGAIKWYEDNGYTIPEL